MRSRSASSALARGSLRAARPALVVCAAALVAPASGCGDNLDPPVVCEDTGAPGPCQPPPPPAPALDDFLPPVPAPTGDPQGAWAGPIGLDNSDELIDGPAASSMIGDYFLRNQRARFVVQAPTRVIGVVPQGGNLVDAVPLADDGSDARADQFGELSFVYLLGRTGEHDQIEVVQDGSGGGAAVLRARGRTATNDFVNLRGVGLFDVPQELDPDIEDGVLCATTYVLEPDSTTLEISWTLVNPGDTAIRGPFGALSDNGGKVEVFSPRRGFERVGIGTLTGGDTQAPVEYAVQQGPDVAYGILPQYSEAGLTNAAFTVAGVSMLIFGAQGILDLLDEETFYLDLPALGGVTHGIHVQVGFDAADIEAGVRARGIGMTDTAAITGTVTWSGGDPATTARVGFFEDSNQDGALDSDDAVVTYADPDESGAFTAELPPGNYLVQAAVPDIGASAATLIELPAAGLDELAVSVPEPVYFDYTIRDGGGTGDDQGEVIPGRLVVIGQHPAPRDRRLFETFDQTSGALRVVHAVRGTTVDLGDGADPQLALPVPASGSIEYRILASRGTEWSVASALVSAEAGVDPEPIEFILEQVAPADGYIASEYHVHQLGSPDSTVTNELRVASMVAEGVELFAATDHDYVSDLQPVIESLEVSDRVRNIPGVEVTPFVYGHFNAWPLEPDLLSPNRGAIDWSQGRDGYAMIPGEIFSAMRERGADIVQVNHPRSRSPGSRSFQQYFDRAGLSFDYDARQITTTLGPIPNDWLRLPNVSLWSDEFDAIELWNGMNPEDTNGDGVRELTELDLVMRDWFNFLSLGLVVTPIGNSDTHRAFSDPPGVPRTYVRVSNDSPLALMSGDVIADALDTLSGRETRDVVLSSGPFMEVTLAGDSDSAIGATVSSAETSAGEVTFTVRVISPAWAEIDTIEVFANQTPEVPQPGFRLEVTALTPHQCFTSRPSDELADNDVCAQAVGGAQPLVVDTVTVGAAERYEATIDITISAADIETLSGASGSDAWLVFRARGTRAIFPILLDDALGSDTVDTLVEGDPAAVDALLRERGVPAAAVTAPIFVDFDGGGYRAVFSPE